MLRYCAFVLYNKVCGTTKKYDERDMQVLSECGADMSASDHSFRTALHLAASNGSLEVCSFLVQLPGEAAGNSSTQWAQYQNSHWISEF